MLKKINVKYIHPSNIVKKVEELFDKQMTGCFDKKGNFRFGENTNCPVCNGARLKFKFFKNGFNFVKCQKCNLVFANPRPSIEFLKKYYIEGDAAKYEQSVVLRKTAKFRSQIILRPKLEIVNKFFNKNKNKILDIGCASGYFLDLADKYGWNCYGVEPNQDAINFLKRHFPNIKVFNTTIEELETRIEFNTITCWEFIEHVLNPLEIFKKIYSLLDKKGILVLSTPNSEGFDMTVLKELSDVYWPPCHVNYFNPEAIKFVLKKAGFKKVEILTPGIFDLDKVVDMIRKKHSSGIVDKFLLNLYENEDLYPNYKEFKEKFTSFLQENKWSGHMVVIAFK